MDQATIQVKSKKWYFRWWAWVIYLIIIFVLLSSITDSATNKAKQVAQNAGGTTSASDSANAAATGSDQLELVSFNCEKQYGYFTIKGQVKNISGASLKDVEAVGSIFTEDGTFVTSANAILEYNPVLPGQTSPFTVMSTDNPEATKCQIEFKELFGGTIPTKVDK